MRSSGLMNPATALAVECCAADPLPNDGRVLRDRCICGQLPAAAASEGISRCNHSRSFGDLRFCAASIVCRYHGYDGNLLPRYTYMYTSLKMFCCFHLLVGNDVSLHITFYCAGPLATAMHCYFYCWITKSEVLENGLVRPLSYDAHADGKSKSVGLISHSMACMGNIISWGAR